MRLKEAGARSGKAGFLTLRSWGFIADTDEEPQKSFKQGSGVCLADVSEENKSKGKKSN